MSESRHNFLTQTGLIALCTTISRVLGVLRDSVSAAFFGAGFIWDAFSFAFRIPNLFRRLFGEGALSAAFIPVFTEYLERGDQEQTARMAASVAAMLSAVLLVLLSLGELGCLLVLKLAPLSDKWELALSLTAVMLPYSFLICWTAYAGGILHSFKHFVAPAVTPIILNACWILAAWLSSQAAQDPRTRVFILAFSILVAGLFQLALQLRVLRAKGFRLAIRWEPRNPGLRRCMTMLAPIILGLAAFQLNVLMDGVIAIGLAGSPEGPAHFALFGRIIRFPLESGANSILYYADRLMQFPLGVFGIALATALFPTLATHAARKNWTEFSDSLRDALSVVFFIGLPASAGMIVLREPLIKLVFERGAFTPEMTARAADALFAYSCGIWAYCTLHVLIRAFYAIQDTITPVRVAASMVALNLTLNLILVWIMKESGMAASTAFSAAMQCVVLIIIIRRRGRLKLEAGQISCCLKTIVATGVMALVCVLVRNQIDVGNGSFTGKLIVVAATLLSGLLVFFVVSIALRNRTLSIIRRLHVSSEKTDGE